MAAVPPAIMTVFKEEQSWGGRRAQPAGPVNFYHKVRPFSEACFLLSSPVYFYLGLLGPNQVQLPPLAAKKAKTAGTQLSQFSKSIISHLLELAHLPPK